MGGCRGTRGSRGAEARARRAGRLIAAAMLAAVLAPCLCGVAAATPSMQFRASFVPIPGYAGTGNFYGGGAALKAEFEIHGIEYRGFPPPLIGLSLFLPKGTRVDNTGGFPTCAPSTLEPAGQGPKSCLKGSAAGRVATVSGVVPLGGETLRERATIESFYAPGGGIEFYVFGKVPALLEVLMEGHYLGLAGVGGFGPELEAAVPLVEAVPGAGEVSLESITMQAGTAYMRGATPVYYTRVPPLGECPKGGLEFKAGVTFAQPANPGTPAAPNRGETVTATYRSPCPTRAAESEEPAVTAPQTPLPGTGGAITAPSNRQCVSRRHFTVHFVQHGSAPYREAAAYLNGRRIATRLGARTTTPIDLRGLPKGTYVLRLTAITVSGRRITGTRTYHACAARPIHPSGKAHL